jgi:selT/selW/selH-like putative selenoprotein
VAGHGGVFEVSVGDKLIFSKKASGRFPDDGEVVELLSS